MKIGTKIVSNMPITKIIILAVAVSYGASYRPVNFQKIRAAGPGFDRGFLKVMKKIWILGLSNAQNPNLHSDL